MCRGKVDWRKESLVSQSSEHAFYIQVCLVNFTSSLETDRKEVIRIILHQYLIRKILTFHYHQSLSGVTQANSILGYKGSS